MSARNTPWVARRRVCAVYFAAVTGVAALMASLPVRCATSGTASEPVATQALPSSPATTAPGAAANTSTVRVFVPDGQLSSHPLRVYVNRNILPDQMPRLRLLRSHAVTKAAADEAFLWEPGVVAPAQEWNESVDGQVVRRSGTLLMFDIGKLSFGGRAMVRVTPVLSWTEGGASIVAIGTNEVNLGNIVSAIIWSAGIVGLALIILIVLSLRGRASPLLLLTGVDGHLSLAQTQVACWTVVVGGVVLGYGLIRLQIPDIPESLIVLMGASLTTGGVAYFQDAKNEKIAAAAGMPLPERHWTLGDLIRVFKPGEPPEVSLAKAQMLFWTALLIVLFVSKSILDGAIWEVPWPLVALLGFSQASYLAPKLVPQT